MLTRSPRNQSSWAEECHVGCSTHRIQAILALCRFVIKDSTTLFFLEVSAFDKVKDHQAIFLLQTIEGHSAVFKDYWTSVEYGHEPFLVINIDAHRLYIMLVSCIIRFT